MKQIVKGWFKALKQIGSESVEKAVESGTKVAGGIISGQQLLGGIKKVEGTEARKIEAEERAKKEEAEQLSQQIKEMGRNVGQEMEKVRQEKKRKEEEEEKKFLEKVRQQREAERSEGEMVMSSMMMESANPAKRRKSKGSAFVTGKKKSQPQIDQMSQTSEFKGKVD